jgi:hypothetical protein
VSARKRNSAFAPAIAARVLEICTRDGFGWEPVLGIWYQS